MSMTQLLLCGPQSCLPSEQSALRQLLLRRTSLCTALSSGARALPSLLRLLAAFDASLHRVSASSVDFLLQWIEHGTLSLPVDTLPNVVALPFAVLLQVALFLQHLDKDDALEDYSQTIQSLQQYGVQGFCTGFLTASAIGFSENEEQLAEYTVTSLRLAVCIGAYIDQNALYAEPANSACTLSVRWREGEFSRSQVEGLLASYPHVRVSTSSFSAALLTAV
jgi:hypothetical protein